MQNIQTFDPRQEMLKKSYEVFLYSEPRAATVEVHHHDFYEVYCFMGGEAEYWVEGRTYILRPGDLLLISPMELHRPIVKSGSVYKRIVLWIDKGYLDGLSYKLTRCFVSGSNLLRGGNAITERLQQLVNESYGNGYSADICADGIFLQLMVEINRLSPLNNEQKPSLISEVLEYIGKHYGEKMSLDSIAAQFYVSKYYLSHEFKKETGTSLYRYLTLKRLAAARQMLVSGSTPGDACAECGFGDYTVFYKAFKAEYGVSPNAIQ